LLLLNPNQTEYTLGPDGDHCFTDYVYATSTAAVSIAGTVIPCSTTSGMTLGDFVGVELSTNVRHWSTISVITPGVSITIADPLTAAVNSGATIYTHTTKIDRPVRVLGARGAIGQVGSEQDLRQETRESYYKIVNKTDVSSDISSWYYSPQLTNGKMLVWQAPRNCNQLVRFTFVKPQYVNQDQSEDVLMDEKEKVVKVTPFEHYTKFSFVPNPDGGFYDIGFGRLLGSLNASAETLVISNAHWPI